MEQAASSSLISRALRAKPSRPTRRFSDADKPANSTPASMQVAREQWMPKPSTPKHYQTSDPATSTSFVASASSSSSSSTTHQAIPPIDAHVCPAVSFSSCAATAPALCAIARVFSTPELLTMLLSTLPTPDIWRARCVSREWATAVQRSPRLRRHLFARPQWRRPAQSFALLELPTIAASTEAATPDQQQQQGGLEIARGAMLDAGQRVSVRMTLGAARALVPAPRRRRRRRARSINESLRALQAGARSIEDGGGGAGGGDAAGSAGWDGGAGPDWAGRAREAGELEDAELFVAQPPIVSMQAFGQSRMRSLRDVQGVSEGLVGEEEAVARAKLFCDAGITLGFLAETTQSLLLETMGAEAVSDSASIEFRAIVSFCPPTTTPRRRGQARSVIPII